MKGIVLKLLLLALVFAGCDNNVKQTEEQNRNAVTEKSGKSYLTEEQLQEYINNKINIAFDLGNEFIIDEAADVVYLIRNSVSSILKEEYASAIENLTKAIAKARLIEKGNTQNVIAEVNIAVNQNVNDAESATSIINQIDSLMELGEIQRAKHLYAQLTNEINITKESISIPDYLQVMNRADVLMKNKEWDEALFVLNSILGKSIIEKRTIPLPLLRAQRMVDEVEKLLGEEELKTENIGILLTNAEYEIKFAKLLGYGKSEKEYKNILEELASIKGSDLKENGEKLKSQIKEFKNELNGLKNKISAYQKV